MSITLSGIGSGLDISGIVTQLVAAERAPAQNRLTVATNKQNATISALGQLKASLTSFNDAVAALKTGAGEFGGQTINFAETEGFSITQTAEAAPGLYAVRVRETATTARYSTRSAYNEAFTSNAGSLQFTNQRSGDSVTVNIAAGSSLGDIAAAINAQTGSLDINARVLTFQNANGDTRQKLVYETTQTGRAGRFDVEALSGGGQFERFSTINGSNLMRRETQANDARIQINSTNFYSETNSFDTVIEGTTIDIERAVRGQTVLVEVQEVLSDNREKVQAVIDAYNTLKREVDVSASVGSDGNINTLEANFTVRQIQSQIRDVLNTYTNVGGVDMSLASLGVRTNFSSGELELDSEAFNAFNDVNGDRVAEFFDQATTGFADRLDAVITPFTEIGGFVDVRVNSAQDALSRISDQQESLDRRIASLEARLFSQYTAMDSLLAQLQTQTQALAGITVPTYSNL